MSFHVRELKTSDAEKALQVLRSAFPRLVFERTWWDWFFEGPSRTYGLINVGGAICGLFSLIDYPEVQSGKYRIRAALAGNLCLLPEYQRKNRGDEQSLFVTLSSAVFECEQARGTEAILVVPNSNSTNRLQEMGWQIIDQLVTWSRPTKIAISGGSLCERKFPARLEDFVHESVNFQTRCGLEFTAWRLARPGANYICVETQDGDWAILKKYEDSATGLRKLHVMDFYGVTEAGVRNLLGGIESWMSDCDTVDFWLPESNPLVGIAAQADYQPAGSRPLLGWFTSSVCRPNVVNVRFSYLDCDVY